MRLGLALLVSVGLGSLAQAAPPNIVFILADDLGVNDLACYGRKDHTTPHLDALAKAGVRFTTAYASCPVCSPTRAAILTGQNPAKLHLTTFLPGRADCPSQKLLHPKIRQQLPLDEVTLAERLKDLGYATGCFGKWHLGGKGFQPTDQGFDTYYAGSANTTPSDTEGGKGEFDLTDKAVAFIEKNQAKPFFVYLAHNTPHIPYKAKPELVAKHAKAFDPTYAAVIESMDAAMGRLLAKLDELKLSDNTLVVFTSDNGGLHVPELNHVRITHNTPYRAGKGFLYEGGLRVPAIVRWPAGKVQSGRILDRPILSTDWFPTILDTVGHLGNPAFPGVGPGQSLLGLLRGTGDLAARPLWWHLPHYVNQGGRPGSALRLGTLKLIENYEDGSLELYDLAQDPGETKNLAPTQKARAEALQQILAVERDKAAVQMMAPNPMFDSALHRKLYVDFDPSTFQPAAATEAEWTRVQQWRKDMNAVVPKAKK